MRTNTFLASILFFTLFISSSWSYEVDPDTNNLIISTDQDFSFVLKENQYFLVNFHALWCKYSKQLKPEWIKVSKALIDDNFHVKVAQVEAYDHKDLAQKYGVEGTPTIKFFINQQPHEYKGLNNASNILEFINRKLGKPLSEAYGLEAVQTALSQYEWIGILVGGDPEKEGAIKEVAFENSDVWFVKTASDEVKNKYGKAEDGVFILVNNITGSFDTFSGTFAKEGIAQFIKEKKFPNVPRLSKGTAEKIFYGDEPAMILIKATADGDKEEELAFQTASKAIAKDIVMTIATYDEEIGRLLCRNLGIEQSELPTVRIVKPGNDRILKYYFDGKITIESVQQFYQDYLNKKAKRFYLSEPVPRDNSDLVRKVVGKNFDDVVNDPNLDVLLFITVPWCSHCVALNPIYDNVARKTHDVANFLVAKIDASENDLEAFGLDVLDFPTILFFPKDNKTNPVDLQGQKDEYAFDTFIRAHASVDLTGMKGPNPFDKDEL